MSLSVEQSASMEAFSRSMEELAKRTIKLNKRIMEELVKEAKHFFSEFLSYMSASIQVVNIVQICACNQGVNEVVTEVNQIKNIQQSILDVLEQLEIFCSTLADIAGSIAKGIELLNNDKEGMGRELGQLSTPILQDVVSGLLGESLKEELWNPEKEGIESINLGRIVLGLSFALATFELADSDDVISRLIGAPITAFLAGYTYTGNVTISLIIGGVTLAVNGLTEVSKFLGDGITEYINEKWDLDLPSLEESGMKDWSFFDFVEFGLSPEGLEHPFATGELITLVLFGPDFSWDKFWKDQKEEISKGISSAFKGISQTISKPFLDLWERIKAIWNNVSSWFKEKVVMPMVDLFSPIVEKISGFFTIIWGNVQNVWNNVMSWLDESIVTPVVTLFENLKETVSSVFEGLKIIIEAIWSTVSTWFNENVIIPIIELFKTVLESVSEFFLNLWEDIQTIWGIVSIWFDEYIIQPVVEFFRGLWETVSGFFADLWNDIKEVWFTASAWFEETIIMPIQNAFETVCNKISEFFEGLWEGIKKGVAAALNAIISGVESAINWVIKGINKLLEGFNSIVSWAADIIGTDWGGITLVQEVSFGRIPAYSTGGFPEDGLFYANHNELIGQFANGQTAVVNNNMITTGIEEAAYRGFARAMSENEGVGIDVKVSADPQGIFKVVQEQNIRESSRLQRAALGW